MTADSALSSGCRNRRDRRTGAPPPPLPVLLLLFPLLLATLAAADKGTASLSGPEFCLEGGGNATPLLMLDWTEDAPVIGCSCELLPPLNINDRDNDDQTTPRPSPPTGLLVGPGDSRVFCLLQPSARLACSAKCGRVTISAVGDTEGWVFAPVGVVGLAGATVRVGGCGGGGGGGAAATARAFFSSDGASFGVGGNGGGRGDAAVHALRLRASPAGEQDVPAPAKAATLPRAAAALLFVGLNAAAAALSPSLR